MLGLAGLTVASGKGSCAEYFGDVSGIIIVIDPDVGLVDAFVQYRDGVGHSRPYTYIHYAGMEAMCQAPALPDGFY